MSTVQEIKYAFFAMLMALCLSALASSCSGESEVESQSVSTPRTPSKEKPSTPIDFGSLRNGDLLFQASEGSDFTIAINQATSFESSTAYTHVGIFAIIDSLPMVIEANPRKGVTATPLKEFMAEAEADGCAIDAKRIFFGSIDCDAAVERAKSYIGAPYDWEFDANNDKMYCSELVQHSFLYADGSMAFESVPMNFKDHSGKMPRFWTELFRKLDKPIPQGEPGTNPNGLSASPLLIPVW